MMRTGPQHFEKGERGKLESRLVKYFEKYLKERRQGVDWIEGNHDYVAEVQAFIRTALQDRKFMASMRAFANRMASSVNHDSLGHIVQVYASPRIINIYGGNLNMGRTDLLDPDNRGLPDYAREKRIAARADRIAASPNRAERLQRLSQERSGSSELWSLVKREMLRLRAKYPRLFTGQGEKYQELKASGSVRVTQQGMPLRANHHVFAYAMNGRERDGKHVGEIVISSKDAYQLLGDGREHRAALGSAVWGKSKIKVPELYRGKVMTEILTGKTLRVPDHGELELAAVLDQFPQAVLFNADLDMHSAKD